jgi:hypothetical protein
VSSLPEPSQILSAVVDAFGAVSRLQSTQSSGDVVVIIEFATAQQAAYALSVLTDAAAKMRGDVAAPSEVEWLRSVGTRWSRAAVLLPRRETRAAMTLGAAMSRVEVGAAQALVDSWD